jgi:hypothetical protein
VAELFDIAGLLGQVLGVAAREAEMLRLDGGRTLAFTRGIATRPD